MLPCSAGSKLVAVVVVGFFSPTVVNLYDVILKRVCSPHVPLNTGLGIHFECNQAQVL